MGGWGWGTRGGPAACAPARSRPLKGIGLCRCSYPILQYSNAVILLMQQPDSQKLVMLPMRDSLTDLLAQTNCDSYADRLILTG